MVNYASSKAGAEQVFIAPPKGRSDTITRSLAKELGPKRIRVNAINPGMVMTEGVQSAGLNRK